MNSGVRLERIPVVMTGWPQWRLQHPDTTVLSHDTGHIRLYELGQAYGDYFASPDTMFPVWRRSERLPCKAWVFGLRIGDAARAYPVNDLSRARIANDVIGGKSVVLVAGRGPVPVRGVHRDGDFLYQTGAEIRAGRPRRTGRAAARRAPCLLVRLVLLLPPIPTSGSRRRSRTHRWRSVGLPFSALRATARRTRRAM
ncbi:MAG: DUF3179 domain-containing protein [Chloroflexi bacterium]|nr:DUF3179 domain-containing protein [Chloroflexota bacterium]